MSTFVDDLMSRVLSGNKGNIVKLENSSNIELECPENFNLMSECFGAVVFDQVDPASRTLVSGLG